jgi:hypothetical protein
MSNNTLMLLVKCEGSEPHVQQQLTETLAGFLAMDGPGEVSRSGNEVRLVVTPAHGGGDEVKASLEALAKRLRPFGHKSTIGPAPTKPASAPATPPALVPPAQ